METYLGRYAGLILYLKEMDEGVYSKLCAVSMLAYFGLIGANHGQAYFSAASDLHGKQMKTFFSIYADLLKKPCEEDTEQSMIPDSAFFGCS